MGLIARIFFSFHIPKKHANLPNRLEQIPRDISEHLAKDIGLTAQDLRLLRHSLPSQSANAPRL